jgi:hypothetical protein
MLFASIHYIFADEILLKDGRVIKGKIIQITSSSIEYDPDGPMVFDTMQIDNINKVSYDDGRILRFSSDKISTITGQIITCSIIKISQDKIIFLENDAKDEKTIERAQVKSIEFADGKLIEMNNIKNEKKDKIAPQINLKGFAKSIVRISFIGGGGEVTDGIARKEKHILNVYKPDIMLSSHPFSSRSYTYIAYSGLEIDLMMPAKKFEQNRAFSLMGINTGIRARYEYQYFQNNVISDIWFLTNEKINSGKLMEYHGWTAGPVLNFIFGPRSNKMNMLFSVFAGAGQIVEGKIHSTPAIRDNELLIFRLMGLWPGFFQSAPYNAFMSQYNILLLQQFNKSDLKGYRIRGGLGPEFVLNAGFPLTVGLRYIYSYTHFGMTNFIPLYGGKKKMNQNEYGGELALGVHF